MNAGECWPTCQQLQVQSSRKFSEMFRRTQTNRRMHPEPLACAGLSITCMDAFRHTANTNMRPGPVAHNASVCAAIPAAASSAAFPQTNRRDDLWNRPTPHSRPELKDFVIRPPEKLWSPGGAERGGCRGTSPLYYFGKYKLARSIASELNPTHLRIAFSCGE